jgi:hypothetical protein
MFRALLAHPQEALYKRNLVIACVLCQLVATRVGVELRYDCVRLSRYTHSLFTDHTTGCLT